MYLLIIAEIHYVILYSDMFLKLPIELPPLRLAPVVLSCLHFHLLTSLIYNCKQAIRDATAFKFNLVSTYLP
jgi:hypothetical protein